MNDFNAQNLTITAWAFAMPDHTDELLFMALAQRAAQRVSDFDAVSLTNKA